MLRLLLVALPLVVALPAAFDKPELHAFQFEAQSPLQFKVRSPPESRPLRPAATRAQHYSPATAHSTPHAHHPPSAHITMNAPWGTRMRARRSTPRSTSSPTSSQPKDTNPPQVCPPDRPAATHAAQLSVGPAAALRARARPMRMLQAHAHEVACARCPLPRLPDSVDSAPAARSDATCAGHRHVRASERAASPVLLTACALLPRCRQPQLREVGLDGHRALDISDTTGRRDVDTTVTRIRPLSRPRALPLGPGGAKPVHVKPVPVIRVRSSSRLRPRRRTARPAHHRVRPHRLRPGHRRHDSHSKHHRGLHAGAASRTTTAHTHPCSTRLPPASTPHAPHTRVIACHSQPASTPPPVPQLTRFSCLRAALARQDLLVAHRGRRDPWFVLPAS